MVSFICDLCQEVKTKPKALAHFSSCRSPTMSCIDCGITFTARTIGPHTSCMTEAFKYGPRSANVDSQTYCGTCALPLNGAVHALQHYESKKHRKNKRTAKHPNVSKTPKAPEVEAPPKVPEEGVPVEAVKAKSEKSRKSSKKRLRHSMKAAIAKSSSGTISLQKLTAAVKMDLKGECPEALAELVVARSCRAPFQMSESSVSLL
jgi:LYAR-type C2HC zinc finger